MEGSQNTELLDEKLTADGKEETVGKTPKPPKAPKVPEVKEEKEKKEKAPKPPKAKKEKAPKPPKMKKEKSFDFSKLVSAIKERRQSNRSQHAEGGKFSEEASFHPISSIKVKVSILVVVAVMLAAAAITLIMVSYTKKILIDANYAKMTNIVESYGRMVSLGEVENDKKAMKTEAYADILDGLKVDGAESSYCYVINQSGIIVYSADETMVNKPNKVKVITKIITELAKGHRPEGNLCCEYEENGQTKYASYYITEALSVVVMCAEGRELMKPINTLVIFAILIAVLILGLSIVIAWFVVGRITKPIKQITGVINDTAKLKLRTPDFMDGLCRRTDETGVISRAVKEMTQNLYEVVKRIDQANTAIKENMGNVEVSSNQVHMFCTDNSATTEQLSASTQEVANMTVVMFEHVEEMSRRFDRISEETVESNKSSEEIAARAKKMQESTGQAITETKAIYEEIRTKTENAVNGLKAVAKINELTNAIIEISDQTSLLSLNASIEAARAGEAGRGFAVVATEISNLAHKSLDSVNDINAIIEEINGVVSNISESMKATTDFLEKKVLAGYDYFASIGEQYLQDAYTFQDGMLAISKEADSLNESVKEVADAVERIKSSIEETSVGVTDIAAKTGNVVEATSNNYELTNNTLERINELEKIVETFEF